MALTDADRRLIARLIAEARELSSLSTDSIRKYTGEEDLGMARASALGMAQYTLAEMAAAMERLAGDQA